MKEVKNIVPENVISCNQVGDNKIYIAVGDCLFLYMLTQRHSGEHHAYSWRSMGSCQKGRHLGPIKGSIKECVIEAINAEFTVMEFDSTKEMAKWVVDYYK